LIHFYKREMVVRENELEVLISTWRDKLFSVQNTILELLEGLDRLETQKNHSNQEL